MPALASRFESRKVHAFLMGAASIWALFVFAVYFSNLFKGWTGAGSLFPGIPAGQNPMKLQDLCRTWGENLRVLAVGSLVIGIFWSCGKRIFQGFSIEAPQPLRFLLQTSLGLFLANLFWMGTGLAGLWVEPLWLTVFLLLSVLFLMDLLKVVRDGVTLSLPVRGVDRVFAGLCLLYAGFLLFQDLVPETFYDSLNYFLGIPFYWLSRHGICDQPLHLLSGYFHGGSLFFLNGYVLAGSEGAKVLGGAVLLGCAALAWGWAGEWGGAGARWPAAMATLTFPLLFLNAWAARVDGLLTFLVLLSFYCFSRSIAPGKGSRSWSILTGLFATLALSVKPTAVVFIAAGFLGSLLTGQLGRFLKKAIIPWAALGILEVGPWLLKNLAYTGNPFFPYAQARLGFRHFSDWGYQRLLNENQQFLAMDQGPLSWITLPWRLTIPGAADSQFIGPLLLAFLPFVLFLRWRSHDSRALGIAWAFSFLLGLSLSHMLRFSIPCFGLGFLFLSCGWTAFAKTPWGWLWPGAVGASALLCAVELFALSGQWVDAGPLWSGRETRVGYLSRRLGADDMKVVEWANGHLPKDARILAVGDARALYYERQVLTQSTFDDAFFARAAREGKDGADILRHVRETGVSYLLIHQGLGALYAREYHHYELTPEQWRRLDGFVQGGLDPVFVQGAVGLFRIRDSFQLGGTAQTDPFSFLSPQAGDFFRSLSDHDQAKAGAKLKELLQLFPKDPYWLSRSKGGAR